MAPCFSKWDVPVQGCECIYHSFACARFVGPRFNFCKIEVEMEEEEEEEEDFKEMEEVEGIEEDEWDLLWFFFCFFLWCE